MSAPDASSLAAFDALLAARDTAGDNADGLARDEGADSGSSSSSGPLVFRRGKAARLDNFLECADIVAASTLR